MTEKEKRLMEKLKEYGYWIQPKHKSISLNAEGRPNLKGLSKDLKLSHARVITEFKKPNRMSKEFLNKLNKLLK